MRDGGFLEPKRTNGASLAVVILLHGAAITALALSKMEYVRLTPPVLEGYNVPITDPPPPEPVEKTPEAPRVKSVVTYVPPKVKTNVTPERLATEPLVEPQPYDPFPGEAIKLEKPADPPKPLPAVRVEAKIDPRSELQPPYPASEQRAGNEGSVTVRLLIGADGRVKAVEKVRAASDAFWRATERQALRHWRFTPALVDGKPVESRTTVTVHFELTA
ncbi:TonB family protein [Sphingosinicella sp. LY1275]|uniref:energy transducer TonB n=1 Tax=Sphingosinicella sp. LY1275 TaxID=3095379 RepID=UPI002ADEDFE5|nr:TonB family protein [Sphingosinicella sp. LY1275]MEA1014294.1 TonB family protein [Sphingosinicella sp. LY1275]